jgi:ubiquinone/menaquinone biosynthesis C-methylase UbiE
MCAQRDNSSQDGAKAEAQMQWEARPCGAEGVHGPIPESPEWFREARRVRFDDHAPWIPTSMLLGSISGREVLEIGVGIGCDHYCLAQQGNTMTGLDLSREHLRLTTLHLQHEGLTGTAVHGDAENMPFPDNSFDVIYSCGALHHTPDFEKALSECARVLRPGGQFIIAVYHRDSLFFGLGTILRNGILKAGFVRHGWARTLAKIEHGAGYDAVPLVRVYSRGQLKSSVQRWFEVESLHATHVGSHRLEVIAKRLGISRTRLERALGWAGWYLVLHGRKRS